MGQCYLYGSGVPTNQTEAFKWYKAAADAGCVAGLNNLAYCHELGYGVAQNYPEAFKLYSESAKQGKYQLKSGLILF